MDKNSNNKSPHILNTSSNLLGICFIVLTSLHVLKISQTTLIDEFTIAAIILFMTASLLSFLSLRSKTEKGDRFEKIADIFFLTGLSCMFVTTIFVALGVMR